MVYLDVSALLPPPGGAAAAMRTVESISFQVNVFRSKTPL